MGIAANLWHWTPETFWRATAHEFFSALEVHEQMNRASDSADVK